MRLMQSILMRAFGRPQGILGRLGGAIMARMNDDCGTWVIDLLKVTPNDRVLEVGFGPGVVIQRLVKRGIAGHVAGIDLSREMVEQARSRNGAAVQHGRVKLRRGSVESLPFNDGSFDKALAINSMQVLAECRGRAARITTGDESWRRYRNWLYPLFGAAKRRIGGSTHGRWLQAGPCGGVGQGILCLGGKES